MINCFCINFHHLPQSPNSWLSSNLTTNKPSLSITSIHPNQFHIKKQRPIHPWILQHEIQSSHPTERRWLRPHQRMFLILRRIRQRSIGDNNLSNAPWFHCAECTFKSGNEGFRSQCCTEVVYVLVECSSLRSSLGLKWPPKITNSIPTPIKHHPITILKISASKLLTANFDILVRPSLGCSREVIIGLQIWRLFFGKCHCGGKDE
mmetsp:Transcript_7124/g.16196  ORF Transcript_7124/g.16196 Transcript_7124/m.16196 type:complete len:206 (-) Transcript_7124:322-939(-)